MSMATYFNELRDSQGIEKAFSEACKHIAQEASQLDALWLSRFFERRVLDNGTKKLWPTTESKISSAYDLHDGEPIPQFFYCDDDGELYLVTVGTQSRIAGDPEGPDETPFIYASSDMVANGKIVGHVQYTDH